LTYHVEVGPHDQRALIRSADSLAFLVRDTAHVTPANFEICVDSIRAFVEASMNGVNKILPPSKKKVRLKKNFELYFELWKKISQINFSRDDQNHQKMSQIHQNRIQKNTIKFQCNFLN